MRFLRDRRLRVTLLVLGLLFLLAVLASMIVIVPTWLAYSAFSGVSGTPSQEQWALRVSDERRSVLLIIGGALAIVGLIYTALRHRLSQANHELQRDANRTDRYASAIEQLGSDKLDVRLGGIYALERIALDSRRDRGPIGEVLSAFVREHAPAPDGPETEQPLPLARPATDVQAVLTVLGRRPDDGTHPPADLSNAYLPGANLAGGSFRGANLHGVNLRTARLAEADFREARFFRANLHGVLLYKADLSGASLDSANLEHAYVVQSRLDGATFARAKLSHANIHDSSLNSADLSWATLTSVGAWNSELRAANLTSADLSYARLNNSDLSNCDFHQTKFASTTFDTGSLDVSILNDDQRLGLGLLPASTDAPPKATE